MKVGVVVKAEGGHCCIRRLWLAQLLLSVMVVIAGTSSLLW